jgi:crossover junction endodeoxyribonuclease RuvC
VRIIGIDCGSRRTGYGVIDTDGVEHRVVASGAIETSPSEPFEKRLLKIAEGLRRLIREHAPESAAVEEVFFSTNVKTALKLAHVRGVTLLAIAEAGLDLAEYSPLEVKMSVTGYGRAEKQQVQRMVQSLLRLSEAPEPEDAADALGVAICHATRRATALRLAGERV